MTTTHEGLEALSISDRLGHAVALLEHHYDTVHDDLVARHRAMAEALQGGQWDRMHGDPPEGAEPEVPEVDPALMMDATGRYVLLDAATALVNGLAALARADQ